jgi:hypothetical protein
VNRFLAHFFPHVALLYLLISMNLVGFAKEGRDFVGFYAVSNVRPLGESPDTSHAANRASAVNLTLTIRLFNYSDQGDINQPVIELLGSEISPIVAGQFNWVKSLPGRHSAIVSGQFTVTRAEYQSWGHHGAGPIVMVQYKGESGRIFSRKVQLIPRPMPPPGNAD